MDIFNRPPSISEDTLQYSLYPPADSSDKASVTSLATCISEYAPSLLSDFIWHRDPFELKVAEDPDIKSWYLEGRMRVGDCVDDEWCAVWLLRKISEKWDFVISVYDSDGEFLLIEAADELPSWVKPTNAENRVWIYKSRLHLIPLSYVSPSSKKNRRRRYNEREDEGEEAFLVDEDDDFLTVDDGVKLVRDNLTDTYAPPKVETAVWKRISNYPDALRQHIHTTRAYIPVDIAKALLANPSLIQKAVEVFYTRDAIQLRAAHRMQRFPPSTSVLRSVKMTRTAYAQLMGQKFFPPKIFGQWKENEGSREYRWRDLGMKIAVGFEMLYQESKGRSVSSEVPEQTQVEASKDALRRNPDYVRYVEKLVSVGYFRGEREGSRLWNELENKAVSSFIEIRGSRSRQSFARQVDLAVAEAASLGDIGLQEEEDDSWLNVDMEKFEEMLQQTIARSSKSVDNDAMDVDTPERSEEDRIASEQANRLKDLADKVERFVQSEGDIEGARFEDEAFSDEVFSEESDEESEIGQYGDHSEEAEEPTSESTTRQEAMDKLVPGIDPSDYGKMPPSYYQNSQRVAPTTLATDVVQDAKTGKNELSSGKPTAARTKPIREPLLPRDRYEGVDSDDETDEENGESEEEKPQVVGEVEIDMGEEEEEFLEFSRQALGISDEQWHEIIQDRRGRGAFIPESAKKMKKSETITTKTPTTSQNAEGRQPLSDQKKEARGPQPGPRPNVNPELDSFEAVMHAMDAELSRLKTSQAKASPSINVQSKKGKEKGHIITEDEDIETAMEAELKAALERGDDEESGDENEPMDYNLIKNFLESFKSQAGLSGPVSNLTGRLKPGFTFPRDES